MITGIGMDMIEKERVLKAIERPSFLQSVYTEKEQRLIADRKMRAVSNFVAKEAVVKAFGTGFAGIRPAEIEVLRYPSGQPYVVLHGAAKEKAGELGVEQVLLSITDTDRLTQAFVVLEGRRNDAVFGTGPKQWKEAGASEKREERYPVLTAEQMKEVDRMTIASYGIPSLTLMERAAEKVTERVLLRATKETKIGVLCGTGNNGGDGLAVARQLTADGYQAKVFLLHAAGWRSFCEEGTTNKPASCTEEFAIQLKKAYEAGVVFEEFSEADRCDLVVDALFGIGLTREVAGAYAEVLRQISAAGLPVIAVDIASGICADTGAVRGSALKAVETVTFGAAKCGQLFYPGKEYTGKLIIADIGFPKELLWEKKAAFYFHQGVLLKRPEYSNKGTFGKVSVIAGSENMAGAAYFSAYAAARSGAGLVKVITPKCNREILQGKLPEAMLATYEENENSIKSAAKEAVSFATSVAIGPGLGKSAAARMLVKVTAEELRGYGEHAPVSVWDADALNLLSEFADEAGRQTISERLGFFAEFLPEHAVLTPHPGELSRLTGEPVKALVMELMAVAKRLTEGNHLTFVLKDAVTVVAKEEECYIRTSGNSGMATGGSGDVLTGAIAALAAGKMSAFDAAVYGTWLHGLAGDVAAGRIGGAPVLARDIAYALAETIST